METSSWQLEEFQKKIIASSLYKSKQGNVRFDRFLSTRGEGLEFIWNRDTIPKGTKIPKKDDDGEKLRSSQLFGDL